MNYFPFHIGDYAVHTRHLTLMEDLAYRRLIDLYYTRESALPADLKQVARLIGMRENVDDVSAVLNEFFAPNEAGDWTHARCDAEIGRANDAAERARANGKKGGRPFASKEEPSANPEITQLVLLANPEITKSQAPITQDQDQDQDQRKEIAPTELADSPKNVEPPPPSPFDGRNAEILNGKAVVALSPQWELTEAWGIDAEALGWQPREVLLEAEKFRQYWTAGKGSGTRRAVKGWRQTWSNWLGKAAERKLR